MMEGEAQGTTYHIVYQAKNNPVEKESIDKLLKRFDLSLSTYEKNSLISMVNRMEGEMTIPKSDEFFIPCFSLSKRIHSLTGGAFDPTVYPLIEAYGFFQENHHVPSTEQIDSILAFVGMHKDLVVLREDERKLIKSDSRAKLDFNAVAQGMSVDEIASFFESQGVENYFVELGGEIRVLGNNPEGDPWKIGVDLPSEDNDGNQEREIYTVLSVNEGGIATSGNYRKFFEKNGKRFVHTIDPKTGLASPSDILSATVWATSSAEADAFATALVCMGLDASKKIESKLSAENIHFQLVYASAGTVLKTYQSKGFEKMIELID